MEIDVEGRFFLRSSPSKNLRSRGYVEKSALNSYDIAQPVQAPLVNPSRSTRSSSRRLYDDDVIDNVEMGGGSGRYPSPSGLQTPQHFISEDGPNKFLDVESPERNKIAFALQETAPLSFDVLENGPPQEMVDYHFSGLMDTMFDDDLSTPQPSPLSPPYSNESMNPYTPLTETDCEPPTTPFTPGSFDEEENLIPGRKRKAKEPLSSGERGKRRREKGGDSTPESEDAVVPTLSSRRRRRKSPVKELRMFPRIELPPTPQESEWAKMRDGVIKSLSLRYFMCHKNRHWDFGPHLNIVTGENGSGKTAIQTAIMLACGAKASTTGRADSQQSVIQRGENFAMIEVVLSNHNGTHRKRKYGEEIRLRKTITKSSAVTKVQERDGTWKPLKKPTLDSILRPFQIHLNNPVQILTQKKATNFLNTQDPSDMFKSFKDITLITPSEEFLQGSEINIYAIKTALAQKIGDYKELVRRRKAAEAEFKKILELERFKGLCINLRRERDWAYVILIEKDVQEMESKVSDITAQIEEAETEKKQLEASKIKLVSSHEKEKSMVSGLRKEATSLESKFDKTHEVLRQVSKENQGIGKVIKLLQDGKAKLSHELADIIRQQNHSMSVKAHDDERKKRETEEEMQQYQATIDDANQQLGELRTEKEALEMQLEGFREKERDHQALFQSRQAEMKDKSRDLKNLEDAEVTKYDKFGPRIKQLVKRVQQFKKWHGHAPVGPLGAWFTVKKEHEAYAPVIEETLGRSLRSFAVFHPKDVNSLRQLISETFAGSNEPKPNFTSIYGEHRQPEFWKNGKAVVQGYPTILDVLDIQHPKVTEALVEKESIERILLFKTDNDACQLFKNASRVPRTCSYGVSMNCFKFTPAPNYKVQPLSQRKKVQYLQTSSQTAKEQMEAEVQRLQAEVNEINATCQQMKKIKSGYTLQLAEIELKIRDKRVELNRAKTRLNNCESILKELSKAPDMASQYDFLEERKRQLETTLEQRESEFLQQVKAKDASDKALKEREHESKTLKTQLEDLRRRIQNCDDEKGEFQKQCDKLDKRIKECDSTSKSLTLDKKKLTKEMEAMKKDLDKKAQEAQRRGDRLETNRSPEEIKSDLEGRESFYKQNLHKLHAKEEVRRNALRYKKQADDISMQTQFVQRILELLESQTKVQKIHLEHTKLKYLTNFQNYYQIFIQRRGYTGQALFDIAQEKLFYYVGVDKMSESKAQAYIKKRINTNTGKMEMDWKGLKEYVLQLSGGERSFSTVSYISALRQIMPTPFFMMDEFEVFMDSGNRKVSMSILMEQAHSHSLCDAQFFVFTPLEPEELPQDDDYIKYFKLQHNGRNIPSGNEDEDVDSPRSTSSSRSSDSSSGSKRRRIT